MAYSVNRATLVGNVGRDPELRHTAHGHPVCNIVVGTDQRWSSKKTGEDRERTTWHKVVAWDALGELCASVLKKGSKVYVDGQMLYEEYQAKDGTARQKAFVKADQVVVLDSSGLRGARREVAAEPPVQARPTPQSRPPEPPGWDEGPPADQDLPF